MVTNIKIELSDEQRRALAEAIGQRGIITREQLTNLVNRCIERKLNGEAKKEIEQTERKRTAQWHSETLARSLPQLRKALAPLASASGIDGPVKSQIGFLVNTTIPALIKEGANC